MPYKKMSRRPRRKIARRRVAKKTRVSKTVKRYVKRAIANAAENKFNIVRAINQAVTTAAGATPYAFSLLPVLASGSNRYSRQGNSIRVKSLSLNMRLNLLPYNATTNPVACPVAVRVFILSVAPYREIGAFSGSPAASGFFDGETGPLGPQANITDLLLPVSQDFKVYAQKTIYLGCTSATNNFASTSVGAFDNSKFSASYYINVAKYLKSALKYNDTTSSSICENRNMWCVLMPVALDGSSAGTQLIEEHHVITTKFEDM